MRSFKEKFKGRFNKMAFQESVYRTQTTAPSFFWERGNGIWNALKGYWELRYCNVSFRLMDINCLAYMGMIGFFLIFFHNSVARWPLYVLIHAVICLGIIEIIRVGEKYPQNKILGILRTFYPVPLFLFAWEELEVLVTMFYGSHWATDMIVRWDKLIFGVHPTVWLQQLYHPWLNELINFFYAGYYTFFLLVPLSLYVCKKKKEASAVFSLATFVYFTNFCLFFLLPAFSPRFIPMLSELHTQEQTGYLFVAINRLVQTNGSIRTGAFPSSHVAGAFAWALCALRYNRKLGYALIPMAFGIAFSTVYMGLHHGMDPLIGSIWGVITYSAALKLIKIRGEDPLTLSNNNADNH